MNRSMPWTLLMAFTLIALLGTPSWADTPPETSETNQDETASPEAEVRFPDSWESFPQRDDEVLKRLRAARRLMFPFRGTQTPDVLYPSLRTPPSGVPRLDASRIKPCRVQAGGEDNLCEQARAISRMPACVRPEDCQAYNAVRELAGEPQIRRADPPANE